MRVTGIVPTFTKSSNIMWNVFCIVGGYDKGLHIGSYCMKYKAYEVALAKQLKLQDKCYISWTHEKEYPENKLKLIHNEIMNNNTLCCVEPIYFVRPNVWDYNSNNNNSTCSTCKEGKHRCLRKVQ